MYNILVIKSFKMSLEEEKLNQNEWVRGLLNENHKAELWEILAFWEKYKKEWEKMKYEFWRRWDRDKYEKLIMQYRGSKKVYMENLTEEEREILDRLNGVWKDKFIEAYLHDIILYSGDSDSNKKVSNKEYWYKDWKAWKVVMEEWMKLNLGWYNIWDSWSEEVSKIDKSYTGQYLKKVL